VYKAVTNITFKQ